MLALWLHLLYLTCPPHAEHWDNMTSQVTERSCLPGQDRSLCYSVRKTQMVLEKYTIVETEGGKCYYKLSKKPRWCLFEILVKHLEVMGDFKQHPIIGNRSYC